MPLHVKGILNENCTSDDCDGVSVVGVDGLEGVDVEGSMVVAVAVVEVEYVIVSSAGGGRQPDAGTSLDENSTWITTDEIGAGGEWRKTPLKTASVDVEKLDGVVKAEPSHGSAGVCCGAACDRVPPREPNTRTAARGRAALASTCTRDARGPWVGPPL